MEGEGRTRRQGASPDYPYPDELGGFPAGSRTTLLPGDQSVRYRSQPSERNRECGGGYGATVSWAEEEAPVIADNRSPRERPVSMFKKRLLRQMRNESTAAISSWDLWQANHCKSLKNLRTETRNVLSYLVMWKSPLRQIEGHFGTGIRSYFSFLRFLVILNLCSFLLIAVFVVIPVITFERLIAKGQVRSTVAPQLSGNCTEYDPRHMGLVSFYEYIVDVLSGTGFLELSYLFYGFYQTQNVLLPGFTYNVSLAYLLTTIFYFFFTLFWIIHRAVLGFKRSQLHGDGTLSTYSNKVFAGWDFCIRQAGAVQLKHNSIRYELQMDLEEELLRQKIAGRTRTQRACIYLTRIAINLVILAVIGAAFFAIYKATKFSQANSTTVGTTGLLVQYLPSIVITAANFITPTIFNQLIKLEQYSPVAEIKLTLLRSVFLKLASLGVLLYSLWSQITCDGNMSSAGGCKLCGYNYEQYQCWETKIGQEMYKLMIFDFLIVVAVMILVEFPRKILVQYAKCKPAQLWGEQEFLVPQHVLEIVYGQSICWIGSFFSPILPLLNTIKYVIIFYLKKLTLFTNCRPANRTFRSSSSNFFFLVVLLFGLLMAGVPFIYSISSIRPSRACGPFRVQDTIWDTVPVAVNGFPDIPRQFFSFIGSLAFIVPIFALSIVVLLFLIVRASGYEEAINQLKSQLQQEGHDKQFLLKKITSINVRRS